MSSDILIAVIGFWVLVVPLVAFGLGLGAGALEDRRRRMAVRASSLRIPTPARSRGAHRPRSEAARRRVPPTRA